MPRCKCQYCKKELNTKEAFKVVKNNINKYWCNEECYNATVEQLSRTVKCRICGTNVKVKDAFKVTKNGVNQYCCSEEEWQAEEDRKKKAKQDKDRVYYLICDMFGYEIQNTKFFDEWSMWNKLKSNEIIYKYIRANETYLQEICDRSYDSEYQKIRYFSAVLKNSLMDFKPKAEVIEKPKAVVVEEHYETKYKPKVRMALEDLEEEYDE